jgi:sec-independent protein translocase protein TatC
MKRRRAQTPKPTASAGATQELPTFLEHIYELRRRLFWVVAIILVASSAAYPFLDGVLTVLTAPLGGQQLYYLTPVGGFSFSIKICIYIGVLVAVPFIMYHLYRYLEPLMGKRLRRSALFYVGMSSGLAILGILFAYFVSLPGALHFLTGMDLKNIQAMLTVDSYLTFVMTYLLGAALLFQIPLLLLIINTMTPLKPGRLKKSQRFVVVAAFIIAAIISPTPDIMNQLLFAVPIIGMYELGVVLVWLQNRSRNRRKQKEQLLMPRQAPPIPVVAPQPIARPLYVAQPALAQPATHRTAAARRPTMIDGFGPGRPGQQVFTKLGSGIPARRPSGIVVPKRPVTLAPAGASATPRSVDGFIPYRPPHPINMA